MSNKRHYLIKIIKNGILLKKLKKRSKYRQLLLKCRNLKYYYLNECIYICIFLINIVLHYIFKPNFYKNFNQTCNIEHKELLSLIFKISNL